MLAFRSGKANVLVATDVAGRGLHIRGLPYIVKYDFPSNIDAYVHRVGRTGRLAANGHAFSFFTRSLARLAPPVVSLLREHRQPVDPNLLILAEAWEEAVKQDPELAAALGQRSSGDEEDDGEEEKEEVEDEEDVPHEVVERNRVVRGVKVKRHEGGERKKSGNEDDDEEERKKGPSGRRKALPGRLRKKLAKEKAGRSGR
jgi:superfamily II DNA/RNA helicase